MPATSPITPELVDQVFEYHAWSPEQVAKGQKIRAAAKRVIHLGFELNAAFHEMRSAIEQSATEDPAVHPAFAEYAKGKRSDALEDLLRLTFSDHGIQLMISAISSVVMSANSAITFEATRLEPIAPELAHTERIETPA